MKTAWAAAVRGVGYYEMRAEEVRVRAEQTRAPWCRRVLLGVVEDYVRLAGDALTVERQREKLRRAG